MIALENVLVMEDLLFPCMYFFFVGAWVRVQYDMFQNKI